MLHCYIVLCPAFMHTKTDGTCCHVKDIGTFLLLISLHNNYNAHFFTSSMTLLGFGSGNVRLRTEARPWSSL